MSHSITQTTNTNEKEKTKLNRQRFGNRRARGRENHQPGAQLCEIAADIDLCYQLLSAGTVHSGEKKTDQNIHYHLTLKVSAGYSADV